MATVTSTLEMFDAFTRPLKNVTQALNITMSAMEEMQNTAERKHNMAKNFEVAREKIAEANAQMVMLAEEIAKAGDEQDRFTRKINKSTSSMGKLVGKAAGLASVLLVLRKSVDFLGETFQAGIGQNALVQNLEIGFTTMMGDQEKAQMLLDDMMAFAKTTPFSFPDLAVSGRNMIAFGMEAENTIPVLNAIGDAVAGIGGGNQELLLIAEAFGAIQVSGRLSMMEINRLESHGIPALKIIANQAGVTASEVKNLISKGAIDANTAIGWLVDGIEKGTKGLAGETAKFGGMMTQIQYTWTGMLDKVSGARRRAGASLMEPLMEPMREYLGHVASFYNKLPTLLAPAVNAFKPVIDRLNNLLESGRLNSFLTALSTGLTLVAWGFSGIAQGALWVAEIVATYWPEITATLIAWKARYIPVLITKLWAMVPPIMAQATAWLAVNWPILLVVAAVGGLVIGLRRLGITTDQVAGFFGGTFASLFSFLQNGFAFLWNTVLSVAEFFGNVFMDPIYAVKKLFYDLVKDVSEFFTSMINGILSGLNWVIEKVNSVAGTSFDTFEKWGNEWVEKLKPESEKDVFDLSRYKLEYDDLGGAFESGYQSGVGLVEGFADAFKAPGAPSVFDLGDFSGTALMIPEIGRVGEVGKINDTVDVSSEDLKVMRELAEMKSIQNFVTLTPTVQVTHTGDINNGHDIDTIVARIEEKLEEEFVASAEGVYE